MRGKSEPRAGAHRLFATLRLPGLGLHHRRDRAAAVLLQQPIWRLPEMRWARHGAEIRARADRAGCLALHAQGRHRALGAHWQHLALLHADAWKRSPTITGSRWRRRGASCRKRCRTRSCSAPAARRFHSPMTTACAPTPRAKPSRASSPISSGAGRKPTANGCARSCRASSPTRPARSAKASA